MDLRRLGYFAVLAEELHFRRAAQRLHIAQPGLSQQIRVLERELGAALFERTSTGVTLTAAGEVLRAEGVPLLHEVDRIHARIRAAAEGRMGALHVVHSRSLVDGVPDELVREFRAQHVDADVVVETAWTARNLAMLRAGEVDAAFVRLPLADADELEALTLGATELVAALRSDHPLARRRTLRVSDLHGVDVVVWPRAQAPGYFDDIVSQVWGSAPPVPSAVEPDPEHLLAAVADGQGVCVLDAGRTARLRPRGVVSRRFRPAVIGRFGLVWNPTRVSPLLAAFLGVCRERAGGS